MTAADPLALADFLDECYRADLDAAEWMAERTGRDPMPISDVFAQTAAELRRLVSGCAEKDAKLTAIRKLTAMAKRSESDPAGWFNDIDRVLDGLAERP